MGWLSSACSILCFFVFVVIQSLAFPLCRHDQSSALSHFNNSLSIQKPHPSSLISELCDYPNILSYPKTSSWESSTDCCLWDGVTCNAFGYVIGLNLTCSWLHGPIHPNSTLYSLTHLQILHLSGNDFQGSHISSQIAQLVSLTHLDLFLSNFYGEVPSQISHLHKLVSLDLYGNNDIFEPFKPNYLSLNPSTWERLKQNLTRIRELHLFGIDLSSIPPTRLMMNLSSSLVSLWLGNGRLHGNLEEIMHWLPHLELIDLSDNENLTGSFPLIITNSSKSLRGLYLYYTGLSGELPHSIGLMKSLTHLNLGVTGLSGELPHSIGLMKSLTHLILISCQLVGTIPASFWNLTQLTYLYLSYNNFSGKISSSISNLQQLTDLSLQSNNFSGEFPSSISRLRNLTKLYLDKNSFSGRIPNILNQLTKLTAVHLSYNGFQGHLPNQISQSSTLKYLSLSYNLLNGTIPSWCFTLPSLNYLSLASNQFTGQIGEISSNSLESLDLSDNKLDGQIPRSIFFLQNLTWLNLSHNHLSGSIEDDLSWNKNMNYLDLSSNLLQGQLPTLPISTIFFSASHNNFIGPISSSICNVTSLEVLNLSHNNFTSTIPQCIAHFSPSLSVLDLQMNRFSGIIPPKFEVGNVLKTLNLHGNLLEGSLPQSLANCTHLEVLDVGRNNIKDTFPHRLGSLQELQVLVLRENKFHGSVAKFKGKSIHSFSKLRILDLSNNYLDGSLPATFFKSFKAMMNIGEGESGLKYMDVNNNSYSQYLDSIEITLKGIEIHMERILTIFTSLDLSKNKFEGEIPQVIGELGSLKGLSLSHNRLTGCIPKSLENLKNLEWLDLSSNKLTGEIPVELTSLTSLSVLNLSHNQLEGCIPNGQQFNTFSNESFEGNVGLCGSQISSACNKEERREEGVWSFEYGGFEFEFGWKAIAMGYGCGAIFGAAMGCVVISLGKPPWILTSFENPPKSWMRRV